MNIGDGFYTFSLQDAAVTDSTFLEANLELDENNNTFLLVHDPVGEGYIFARFFMNRYSYPGYSGFTKLEIFHSDENLNFPNHEEAIIVPLEETRNVNPLGIVLEDDMYLLLRYLVDGIPIFARIGLDGTVKDKIPMPGLFQGDNWNINGMVTYTDNPREYAIYGWDTTPDGDTTFLFHVVDSLFNLQETVVVMENQSGHYHYFNNMISLLPYDGQTYYAISQYYKDNEPRNGLRISKYDKANHEVLNEVLLSSQPIYTNLDYCAFPLSFKIEGDDTLYLAYRTSNNPTKGSIMVVKLDVNLNTLWQRQCHLMENGESFRSFRMLTHERGVVLCAQHIIMDNSYQGNLPYNTVLFLINEDGSNGSPEAEVFIRPYAFWPNPTQDQLRLQHSPDVKPVRIELYDLQGRLVHTQSQDLESVDLQSLTAGQYLMKVTMEDGKAFTDKVVKE